MIYERIHNIPQTLFGVSDIARALGSSRESALVSAVRYTKRGLLVRLKRNVYMTTQRWRNLTPQELYSVANRIQTPSYVSLTTALAYYDATSQMQRDFFESIALQRTKEVVIQGKIFRYTKMQRTLYFGFEKRDGFFIAVPEKALIDAFYLMSYGRYTLDISAIDRSRFNPHVLRSFARKFPERTIGLLVRHGYLAKS